jgi:DNA-binding CsgD family transcriptional regulator
MAHVLKHLADLEADCEIAIAALPDLPCGNGSDERRLRDTRRQLHQLRLAWSAPAPGDVRGEPVRLPPAPPTPRESECLHWCAAGKTAWETGRILGISEWTVVYHLGKVKRRLGACRQQQLISKATALGWLPETMAATA